MQADKENKLRIAEGIRDLDKKYFDFLYEAKDLFDPEEIPSLSKFISEIKAEGHTTMVFNMIKGKTLSSNMKKDLNRLYEDVYKNID